MKITDTSDYGLTERFYRGLSNVSNFPNKSLLNWILFSCASYFVLKLSLFSPTHTDFPTIIMLIIFFNFKINRFCVQTHNKSSLNVQPKRIEIWLQLKRDKKEVWKLIELCNVQYPGMLNGIRQFHKFNMKKIICVRERILNFCLREMLVLEKKLACNRNVINRPIWIGMAKTESEASNQRILRALNRRTT